MVNWERETKRLARAVLAGDTKKSVALAGKFRLWSQAFEHELRIGRHGNHTPILIVATNILVVETN